MQDLTIQGIPYSLLHDGWWLNETTEGAAPPRRPRPPRLPESPATPALHGVATIALLLLIGLADVLFWRQRPGLSLAVFGAAAMASVWGIARPGRAVGGGRGALIIAGLALLPVIEQVQTLSLVFLISGMLGFAAYATNGRLRPLPALLAAGLRLATYLPWFSVWSLSQVAHHMVNDGDAGARFDRAKSAWAMPLAVGLLFIWLLTAANPVLEGWFQRAFAGLWLDRTARIRICFWLAVACPLWPYLSAPRLAARIIRPLPGALHLHSPTAAGLNPASVANALVLFNLIFAVQTLLDLTYLWSGFDLPSGMTHAEYAHRGAYPLVATALLAGAFALISRPFTDGSPRLRRLLALWIGQNVMLVVSSLYRLELYMEAYGLTYLRVAAAIWMGLVAAGLMLTFWQLWGGRSNLWLLARSSALLAATLYACCFVNFAQIIAKTNLTLHDTGARIALDTQYLCDLGPTAAAAILDHSARTGWQYCSSSDMAEGPQIQGWRDWGFRSWRVQRYLMASLPAPKP